MFELVERWSGFEILRRVPGFEFTPVLLGKITSYIVLDATRGSAVFAFMYRFATPLRQPERDEEQLAQMAVDVIKHAINGEERMAGADRTFELLHGRWAEVERPAWWVPYFS